MREKIWDDAIATYIEMPSYMAAFLNEIHCVCKKYNLSIAHEDWGGAFVIEDYKLDNIDWLFGAHKNYKDDDK